MFGLEYILAAVKVFFNVAFAIMTAIPFYYCWNYITPIYLSFIPELWHNLPYWDIVGLFLVCTFLGEQINKLTPKFVKVDQTVNNSE